MVVHSIKNSPFIVLGWLTFIHQKYSKVIVSSVTIFMLYLQLWPVIINNLLRQPITFYLFYSFHKISILSVKHILANERGIFHSWSVANVRGQNKSDVKAPITLHSCTGSREILYILENSTDEIFFPWVNFFFEDWKNF